MSNVAPIHQQSGNLPTLRGGGQVTAIIPQSLDEVFRVAGGVLKSGLAPYALVGKKSDEEAKSAIAIVIMSGAELGLKPMAALRSFTVINGKPALYGDGLINVVRQSGRVAYLRTGCEERNGQLVGYCEAKRSDTGEESRVEFSQDDAVRAGLWQDEPFIRKQVWENRQQVWKDNVPNDSPWFKYPKRMLAWRAAGYCLRELFGDVLGGIRDEFEAREIVDAEFEEVQSAPVPPSPPSPPSPPAPSDAPRPDEPAEAVTGVHFDLESFLGELEEVLAGADSEDIVIEVWDSFDVEATLTDDEDALQRAFDLRNARLKAIGAA
ncbi:hypothetical protein [Pelagibacterium sediminicola]|uniref:hypothetical protein n=1 Tax=Pelagibacterium sediminicola TaxID=2248761 RepID=UPI000E321858|nr:hypothetical protein [Pelagibacterium sediminicola]